MAPSTTTAGFFDNAGGTTDVTRATTITNPTGTGVEIENASTGAVTFAGVTVNKSSTAGTGVSLSGTDTGQTFSFGTLSVTTSNGTALTASGGGTIATSERHHLRYRWLGHSRQWGRLQYRLDPG